MVAAGGAPCVRPPGVRPFYTGGSATRRAGRAAAPAPKATAEAQEVDCAVQTKSTLMCCPW